MPERATSIVIALGTAAFAMLLVERVASGSWLLSEFALLPLALLFFTPALRAVGAKVGPGFISALLSWRDLAANRTATDEDES